MLYLLFFYLFWVITTEMVCFILILIGFRH